MPYLSIEELKVRYVERHPVPTRAAPVVFIHGAGGTHQHWLYQVRDIPHSRSYALDLPGHGRSEGAGRDSIQAYGDWLVSFLDMAGLDQAILAGHSMGGGIALDVALRYPARVAGLGLIATGARLRVAPAILEGFRQNPEHTVRLVTEWAFGPEAPAELVRQSRRQMEAVPGEVFLSDFAACDRFDVMARLGEIAAPVVVVCGTKDVMTPPKYSTYLRDHVSGAEMYLIEGAGHMVMLEKPAEVARALGDLVGRVSA
jgi:pimeloyl-ACP methyl ester carboxylesterase